jgi:hypothetical protein
MTDYEKNPLQKYLNTGFSYYGPIQSMISVQTYFGKRMYMKKEFDRNSATLMLTLRPSGLVYTGIFVSTGDQLDVVNVRNGNRLQLNPFLVYNVGRHLSLSVDHLYEKLKVEGGRLYTANLSNFSAVYQFNRRAFLRTILQYANYDYNTALYLRPRDPKFKHLFTQILFSYKINPQTVLFLGYSDDYYGKSIYPLTQSNRTVFMKIGYALVL